MLSGFAANQIIIVIKHLGIFRSVKCDIKQTGLVILYYGSIQIRAKQHLKIFGYHTKPDNAKWIQ